jgi:valyl-tRNA synthetase
VWYCRDCGEMIVSIEDATTCPKCGSTEVEQDPDVLDTWFSSGLWPHSTLGWPDDTEDLRYFYPTAVMETAYDILFFWVARMIMMGLEDTGEIPFHTVYLHGLIRDEKGEKMSKTRGNVIDPLDYLERYGTDALRFALITGTSPGNDSKLSDTKFEAGRNFANKLWNATRFVLRNAEGYRGEMNIATEDMPMEDRWILSRLAAVTADANRLLGDYQFGEAQRHIQDFLWGEFCDWYIEIAKVRFRDERHSPLPVLFHVLDRALRLLHPFMPFITEELWQHIKPWLPGEPAESIMIADYPRPDEAAADAEAERVMAALIDIVRAVRNARAEHKVEINKWISAEIYADEMLAALTPYAESIQTLARAKPVGFHHRREERPAADQALVLVLSESEVAIPMASMVDIDAERKRLGKEIEQVTADIARRRTRLEDQAFLSKAPAHVVEKERENLASREAILTRLHEQFRKVGGND